MATLQTVSRESMAVEISGSQATMPSVIWRWAAGSLIALLLGSWFVWLAVYLQHKSIEDDIKAACRRAMPETADRCFDTVVIQRGGIRR